MTKGQERLHARQDATPARRRKPVQRVREVLEVRKRDGLQRLTHERAEPRYVTTVRSLRVGSAAVQPQLQQLLVAAGLLVRNERDPALVHGAGRMQDNVSYHAFRI